MLKCIEAINIAKDNIILPEYNIIKDFIAGLKLAFAIGLYLLFIFLCLIILPRINPYFSILGIIFMLFMSFLVPAQIFAISGNKNIFQLFNYKYIFQIIKQQPINYIIKSIGLLLFNILISVITSKRFCYELSLIVQTILSPYIVLVSAYFIAKSVKTHNLEKD